ncbi:hypothetical protein ACPUEX_11385 [Enterobacter vonholyi]|uniref:hypothetical protein n=1 Tax=Enterobacter vonholyi TaxID=2797505 RepID=UPI0011EDB822|nr:hypothetical protein [Enterobacter vonholyi]KAA0509691.1 hypothetical protein F0319_20205 [Enterobacter vonholyi]
MNLTIHACINICKYIVANEEVPVGVKIVANRGCAGRGYWLAGQNYVLDRREESPKKPNLGGLALY